MSAYDSSRYGRVVGDRYDTLYPEDDLETAAAVDFLGELAHRQDTPSLLELGIGTGRLALGVQAEGVRVAGIDGSAEMVDKLRAKPDGDRIEVVIADYRDGTVAGEFGVVCLVFNGIFDPRGRSVQLDIFRNAARHLVVGGYFVVESWVMSDTERNGEWSVVPRYVGDTHVELQLARYDIEANTIERTLVHLRPTGTEFITVRDTYASPGELDVMADVTGFDRAARYADWNRAEFTHASARHVTVYVKR